MVLDYVDEECANLIKCPFDMAVLFFIIESGNSINQNKVIESFGASQDGILSSLRFLRKRMLLEKKGKKWAVTPRGKRAFHCLLNFDSSAQKLARQFVYSSSAVSHTSTLVIYLDADVPSAFKEINENPGSHFTSDLQIAIPADVIVSQMESLAESESSLRSPSDQLLKTQGASKLPLRIEIE